MTDRGAVVVVGGTRAIGLELVKHYARRGDQVVLTGRDPANVDKAVAFVPGTHGITFDLAEPHAIKAAFADVGPVSRLALVAIDRDQNSIRDYDIDRAIRLVTLKLIGYTAVVSALVDRMDPATSSILLFGGMAKERPYPGSTTVTTVNAGVVGLARTLVEELKPMRVNSIHPGVVGDSPYWVPKEAARQKYASETPMGRLCRMDEIVDASVFLLENGGANGVELIVDGGWHTR